MRTTINLLFAGLCTCLFFPENSKALTKYENKLTAPSYIFQSRNSITGFVFGEGRTPVPRVYVELQNDVYSTVARVQTNGSGLYSFIGLPPGQYNVRVLATGTNYEEQTRSVSLIPISAIPGRGSVSEQLDFYLKLRRGDQATGTPGVVFAQTVPDEAKKLYESGVTDLEAKNETSGFEKLKKSLEIFPDYYLALDRLGTEYVNRGYYQPAFVLLTKAIVVNPRSFSSTLGLGVAEFRLGQIEKAIDLFEKSAQLNKNSANAHLWLGIALHSKSNYPKALSALLRANELSNGTSAEVHWQLARVYKDQNKFGKAADELELYLKYNPDAQNAGEVRKIIETLRKKG